MVSLSEFKLNFDISLEFRQNKPFRIVFDTAPPSESAPNVSIKVAHIHTCRSVRAPEPTDVPNGFATSFAPTEKAKKKAGYDVKFNQKSLILTNYKTNDQHPKIFL